VILAPLDNLLWDRKLIAALFGFDYKWEVYTPAADRRYGYYVLPLLYEDRFIGRFEPVANRKSGELVVENWWWEQGVTPNQEMTAALKRCLSAFVRFLKLQALVPGKALPKEEWKWMENCL
jgi:hypothetical protein